MTLGATLKRLRRERDITQEQLAEYLNISASAISQWETDRVMPDISQIPVLANIFDVSADTILGIDIENKQTKIKHILDTAEQLTYNGDFQKAAEYLRTNSHLYPNSHQLSAKLADSLLNSYIRRMGTENCEEIIGLCQKILAECTDTKVRSEAALTLCTTYKWLGNTDEILNISEQMPGAAFTREDFLFWNLIGEEAAEQHQQYFCFCLTRILVYLEQLAGHKRNDGSCLYSTAERIQLYEQIIAVTESLFPDGDYHYQAQYAELACTNTALCFLETGNQKKALYYLERACQFAVHFDTYDTDSIHTSIALRGYNDGGSIMEKDGNRCAQMLNDLLTDRRYSSIQDKAEFRSIIERLKQHAKKP